MNKLIKNLIIYILIGLLILIISNISSFLFNILIFLKNIVLPFFIAFVFAYILQPVVKFFERFLKKRKYAVFITAALVISVMIIFFRMTFPFIQKELSELSIKMPEIMQALEDRINNFANKFSFLPEDIQPSFENIKNMFMKYAEKLDLSKIFSDVIFQIGNIVIIPIILLYLLIDYERIINKLRKYLIKKERFHFKEYLGKLNQFFSRYIKTTILVMILIIMISTITFIIIGIEYPLFFGIVIGITNIIPYVGPYIGGAFPVVYALTTSSANVFAVLISIIAIQLVESGLITPYLHSKNSETHPLLVILSLSVCGSLFGILGMIFAVPILKFIEITITYYPLNKLPIFIKDKK